ncbi:hypothetical protein EVG20_g10919 [Dentipellis fragilis]|uniref:Major facilitator superfamily (MFS) profile domain-containing protein n=1 Tax=Dentipellis fragilis TaxID=205917 RepID=A0A4Y9XPE0_9AGAM|nr:hypothetical protein EVG20_g10919 [Dentipellis fragilis]
MLSPVWNSVSLFSYCTARCLISPTFTRAHARINYTGRVKSKTIYLESSCLQNPIGSFSSSRSLCCMTGGYEMPWSEASEALVKAETYDAGLPLASLRSLCSTIAQQPGTRSIDENDTKVHFGGARVGPFRIESEANLDIGTVLDTKRYTRQFLVEVEVNYNTVRDASACPVVLSTIAGPTGSKSVPNTATLAVSTIRARSYQDKGRKARYSNRRATSVEALRRSTLVPCTRPTSKHFLDFGATRHRISVTQHPQRLVCHWQSSEALAEAGNFLTPGGRVSRGSKALLMVVRQSFSRSAPSVLPSIKQGPVESAPQTRRLTFIFTFSLHTELKTRPFASHDADMASTKEKIAVETTTVPDSDAPPYHSTLEDFERFGEDRPPFILTYAEVKLLGIAGVGFFLDAYDLFIINPVATMLQYRLYGGEKLPVGLEGFMKAAANIGSVIGQFGFGFAADRFGRKAVYGKELMLIIFATIMCISDPTGDLSPSGSLIYLAVFRIILGIGVGGDYPMSASITSDRANLRKRGTMLAYIFANQGWGSLIGSIVVLVVLACYKHVMNDLGETSKVDGAWRIAVGLSLIPACGTLYQRLTLPESTRYLKATKKEEEDDPIAELKKQQAASESSNSSPAPSTADKIPPSEQPPAKQPAGHNTHFRDFFHYFSEWRHLKILIGTSLCWFLLDIAFYGINLNQNVVLQQIGFDGSSGSPWERLWKIAIGNIIITVLGFVPGYYVTVLTIEYLGRKWIQIQGFLLAALFLGIMAGKFHTLNTASFVVCFAFLQFFFNFGANSTTYCYPAEVFPTRYRATAHGISAAAGKTGAIISSLAFNALSEKIGTQNVLWIFMGVCFLGAACTLLLPEVKGRDPDAILEQELREKRAL